MRVDSREGKVGESGAVAERTKRQDLDRFLDRDLAGATRSSSARTSARSMGRNTSPRRRVYPAVTVSLSPGTGVPCRISTSRLTPSTLLAVIGAAGAVLALVLAIAAHFPVRADPPRTTRRFSRAQR